MQEAIAFPMNVHWIIEYQVVFSFSSLNSVLGPLKTWLPDSTSEWPRWPWLEPVHMTQPERHCYPRWGYTNIYQLIQLYSIHLTIILTIIAIILPVILIISWSEPHGLELVQRFTSASVLRSRSMKIPTSPCRAKIPMVPPQPFAKTP